MSGETGRAAGPDETRPLRRVALLVNPVAGGGVGEKVARGAVAEFGRLGVDVTMLRGDSAIHSRELAREVVAGGSHDAVVVCGGDGLMTLAVQECAGSDLPLGLVPAGTGNDLARDLGISGLGVRRAVAVIAEGRVEQADLGRARHSDGSSSYFASILCAGYDSLVNKRVNEMRMFRGRSRYVAASVVSFPTYRARRFRLTLDDEVVEGEIFLSAFGITTSYGGGMRICPRADRTDGLFDVTWVPGTPTPRRALGLRKVFSGRHTDLDWVETRRCRTVRIEAEGGVEAYADGDPVGPLPVTIDVVPGAIHYLVP